MNYQKISIKTKTTKNEGELSFFESKNIGFDIKRIYYIYGAPKNTKRGGHAHRNLKQLLFCPYGEVKIVLSNGEEEVIEVLSNPSEGLLLGPGIWRDMYWLVKDSVLCVAASDYYDEDDYIRNYSEYMEWLKEKSSYNQ